GQGAGARSYHRYDPRGLRQPLPVEALQPGLPARTRAAGAEMARPMIRSNQSRGDPRWRNAKMAARGAAGDRRTASPRERHFTTRLNTLLVRDKGKMLETLTSRREQMIDAHSRRPFAGAADEPRSGLRRGQIPGRFSLPYDE